MKIPRAYFGQLLEKLFGQSQEEMPPKAKRHVGMWDFLKVLIALALVGYVASLTSFDRLWALHTRLKWNWLIGTFVLFNAAILMKATQYHFVTGRRIPYSRMLEVVVLQNALMNLVTNTAGLASYMGMLGAEKDVKMGRAATSFLLVKIGDLFAVLMFILCAIFWGQDMPVEAVRIAKIVSGVCLFLLLFFFAIVVFRRYFVNWLVSVAQRLRVHQIGWVNNGLNVINELATHDQRKILYSIVVLFLLSIFYLTVNIAWAYARFRMFSLYIDLKTIFTVQSILQVASWIPVSILGGLGVSETLSVFLFGIFGEDPIELAAVMLGARLVFYIMNAISLLYLPIKLAVTSRRIG